MIQFLESGSFDEFEYLIMLISNTFSQGKKKIHSFFELSSCIDDFVSLLFSFRELIFVALFVKILANFRVIFKVLFKKNDSFCFCDFICIEESEDAYNDTNS